VLNELDASLDVLAFDDPSGQLQAIQNIDTLPPGLDGAPWAADVQVSHDGQWLFTCERTSSTVATFRVNAENGQLTAMGHTSTEDQPRSFAISADNNYLLVAGQRSNHLSNYRISQDTGQLDLIQRLAIGDNPNWIAIKP
jgi:6-phosphogluconolactonase